MNQITTEEMFDFLEMERNHNLGEAADMTLRRPGFEDTPQDQLNIWITEAEHKAKIVEAIIAKVKEAECATNMRDVTISFVMPDPGEHVATGSEEYRNYYDVNGPHIQLCEHLDELLRNAGFGYIEDWESDDGDSYYIVAKGVNEMVLKETIIKALAENDHGLQYIEVITETEMDLHWAESDALVAKALAEQAEWDAKPQEEKDRILKERQAEGSDIEDMLAAIRKRRDEAREAMKGGV